MAGQLRILGSWIANSSELEEVLNLDVNMKNEKKGYQICATCHGNEGLGGGSLPVIVGQHLNVFIKQLSDIRSRNRENPAMYPFFILQQSQECNLLQMLYL